MPGPADTLWRLSGIEVFDLSGPGGDRRRHQRQPGQSADPRVAEERQCADRKRGDRHGGRPAGIVGALLRIAAGARPAVGATRGGGSISGSGSVDFSGGSPALDLNFTAAKAQLLDRDDIAATVTGPLTIKSDGRGGRIAGNLRLDKGRFTLGRASAAASVPQLAGAPSRARKRRGYRDRAIVAVAARPGGRGQRPDRARAGDQQPLEHRPRRSAGRSMRRASPAAPTWCAAIMNSPAAVSGSSAGSSASRAKARPIRCSTSAPRRKSRASTRRSA